MADQNKNSQKKISDQEVRKLVIERLKTFPSGKTISIGSAGTFTKEQLISHVEVEDKIGEKIIEVQIAFLRSLKENILFDE